MIKDLLVDAFMEFWEIFLTWLIDYQYHLSAAVSLMTIVGGVVALRKWVSRGEPNETSKTDNFHNQNFENQIGGNAAGRDVNINHYHTNAEERVNWQDALDHYKRAYGQDAALEHQQAYARLCWLMGRWKEAVPLHKDILEQVAVESGKAGNEYATALNDLALMYKTSGRFDAAEPLYDPALSITRRVLGDDHPETAGSLNNLAGLYRAEGRYDEAAPLYKKAVEIMKRVLGAEHPNTKIVRDNYQRLLAKMKE